MCISINDADAHLDTKLIIRCIKDTYEAFNTMLFNAILFNERNMMLSNSIWYRGTILPKVLGHCQKPMTCTYGFSHFIHFKTVATEVELKMLSTLIMFPSLLPQFGSAFFSSKEGVPVLLSI